MYCRIVAVLSGKRRSPSSSNADSASTSHGKRTTRNTRPPVILAHSQHTINTTSPALSGRPTHSRVPRDATICLGRYARVATRRRRRETLCSGDGGACTNCSGCLSCKSNCISGEISERQRRSAPRSLRKSIVNTNSSYGVFSFLSVANMIRIPYILV